MDDLNDKKQHSLSLENRARGSMNGVTEVLSYGDDELRLSTAAGLLTVTGKDLKIVRFNADDGSLTFTGNVGALRYDEQKPPILRRIFK